MKKKSSRPNPGRHPLKIRRILVPLDFSGNSRQALDFAVPLADLLGAKITLLHVVEPAIYPAETGEWLIHEQRAVKIAGQELAKLGRELIPPRLLAKMEVRTGRPFDLIARTAQSRKMDLIVITTHGRTGLKRALLGSTAEWVVRHASCPVLTVRRR